MTRIYHQAKRLEGRNGKIWLARVAGATAAQIADEYDMSESNVWRILAQISADIPDTSKADLTKQTIELYDLQLQDLMEIMLSDPRQAYAPNGKPLINSDGKPELDNSDKLAAHDRILKLQQQRSKLLGLDAPAVTQTQMQYSHIDGPAAVDRVVRENAEKATRQRIRTELREEMARGAVRN